MRPSRPTYVPGHARYSPSRPPEPAPLFWPIAVVIMMFVVAAFAIGIWAILDGQQPYGPAEFVSPPAAYDPPAVR